jgi:hypothetical protein
MRRLSFVFGLCLAVTAPLATFDAAAAAPCRDAKGKFVTCPPPAAAKQKCRDAKGKFTACGASAIAPK